MTNRRERHNVGDRGEAEEKSALHRATVDVTTSNAGGGQEGREGGYDITHSCQVEKLKVRRVK